jgi:DNA polymerase III delta subunit
MAGRLHGLYPKDLYQQLEAGRVLPAYYFAGEDRFEKRKAREKLLAVLRPDPSSILKIAGGELKAAEMVGLAETLSLFSENRLIWVEDAHKIPAAERRPLAQYLESPNPSTCAVFSSDEWRTDPADPVMAGVHMLKGLVHFAPPKGRELLEWIEGTVRAGGQSLAPDARERLVAEAGEDREVLLQELERLSLYWKGKKKIEEADVLGCLGYSAEESVNELAQAVCAAMTGRTEAARRRALELADRLLADGEEPARLLNWVGYAAQHLLAAKRMLAEGAPAGGLQYKVRAYYNPDLAAQALRVSEARLLRALSECLAAEVRLKTGAAGASAPLELKELIVRITA